MHIAFKRSGYRGQALGLDVNAGHPSPDINRVVFGAVCSDIFTDCLPGLLISRFDAIQRLGKTALTCIVLGSGIRAVLKSCENRAGQTYQDNERNYTGCQPGYFIVRCLVLMLTADFTISSSILFFFPPNNM